MGEIAEMMLDGTLCASCGGYIENGEPGGIPRYCSAQCRQDAGIDAPKPRRQVQNVPCPACKKTFGSVRAQSQHYRDAHKQPSTASEKTHDL